MEESTKYLIHANVVADGVVERSDVVGAVFGQTEGLLGQDLDLRTLRRSEKVGRIDVNISSTQGSSHGTITIGSSLDKVETATLAASLETITRVGPCRAEFHVENIEDVRTAKRKQVVDRATELVQSGFEDSILETEEILDEIRQRVRVADITEFDGLPAGPRVSESDAIVLVEGRSDVLNLLKYGIKNAIAVEGTNIPDSIGTLTDDRNVTAFFDGDRGGALLLKELAQIGDVDYVAFSPEGSAVEDLDRFQLYKALREKVPFEPALINADDEYAIQEQDDDTKLLSGSDEQGMKVTPERDTDTKEQDTSALGERSSHSNSQIKEVTPRIEDDPVEKSIYDHATEIIRERTDTARFLDENGLVIANVDATDLDSELSATESIPDTILLDGILDQQLIDIAAARKVNRIIARSIGQTTKRPADIQIHSIDAIAETAPDSK